MKKVLILFCLLIIADSERPVFAQANTLPPELGPHTWTATIKVIGEDGNPIVGADVSVQYSVPATRAGQSRFGEIKGITDIDGIFLASHTDSSSGIGISAEKFGYYTTHAGRQFYYNEKNRHPTFTLLLKKIGQPIAMYAKRIDSEPRAFKKTGRPPIAFKTTIGYDFMAGDWVLPYGKGKITDIIFTEEFNKQSTKDYFYKLTVSFPNAGDGIQEFDAPTLLQDATMGQSDLTSMHESPVDGYQSIFVQNHGPDLNRNYYFRVRTVLDSDGNVKSALYGKIYGDFMQFRYYLNPNPNSRNVEFDTKQNLLGGLTALEQVNAP